MQNRGGKANGQLENHGLFPHAVTICRCDQWPAWFGNKNVYSGKTLHKVTWRVISVTHRIYSWDVPSGLWSNACAILLWSDASHCLSTSEGLAER